MMRQPRVISRNCPQLRLAFDDVVRQPHMGLQRQGGARFLAVDGGAKDLFMLAVHVAPAGVGSGQARVDVAVTLGMAIQDRQQLFAPA